MLTFIETMKNLTLEEFKRIHEEWKSTGLSIRDYCHNTGFEESKFYYWRKKFTEAMLPQVNGFVPVNMFHRKHPIKYTLYFHKIENSISTLVKS